MATATKRLVERFPDLKFIKLTPAPDHPHYNYPGFRPGTETIPKGHVRSPGRRPFPNDVIFDRDLGVPMRDGIKIFTDIFRPVDSGTVKYPVLIAWSPYGKTGSGAQQYETMGPYRCGVPLGKTSGYEKFEGPDPAEWCCGRGYIIANVDCRGAGMSQGDTVYWGIQEAEDVHDTIDWCSKQPWCDGSVAMIGNSWLAIAQINFASRLKHPALKALAPMEAFNDPYRDNLARGGKPHRKSFGKMVISGFAGPGRVEGMGLMLQTHPLFDEYWQSKYIDTSNIDVPLYLTASYSSGLHTKGSFNTYRTAKSKHKWLRVHPYQEWYDLYRPEVTDELQMFYDRFCKRIDNGWESKTPPVRLSLLAFDGSPAETIIERPEKGYPLARQRLVTYYMDASDHTLKPQKPSSMAETSHESHSLTASSDFTLHFDKYTEIAGYAKATVWVSCPAKDDMDITVHIRKTDHAGKMLEHLNYPCPVPAHEVPNTNVAKTLGPEGFLRASHAISRDPQSDGQEVSYAHDRCSKIPRGTKVRLEITLWPMGMVFARGEGLVLRVSGREMIYPEIEAIAPTEPEDENEGLHTVYTGGENDSCLILPVIAESADAVRDSGAKDVVRGGSML